MNFIPKKPIIWVGDANTAYTVQDYVPMSATQNMFTYFLYVVLWLGSLHLLNLFNNKYDRTSIIMAFLIGLLLMFLLDWVNGVGWEIVIDKDSAKYYILNNDISHLKKKSFSNFRIMTKNNVYKMKNPNYKLLMIAAEKYIKHLDKGKFTDEDFTIWRGKQFKQTRKGKLTVASADDETATSKNIGSQIEVLMQSSYYVFTILITLSAVAYRVNRDLFNRIIPWVLSSAIVGLGSMFFMLWERKYSQLLMHLAFKKKLLITSISFAMAACFIFLNNI